MPKLIARLIDVFADEPLTGNPLAVVQAADELSEEQMRLAGEFNQARPRSSLRARVRIESRGRLLQAVRRSSAPGTTPSERVWASMEILAL